MTRAQSRLDRHRGRRVTPLARAGCSVRANARRVDLPRRQPRQRNLRLARDVVVSPGADVVGRRLVRIVRGVMYARNGS